MNANSSLYGDVYLSRGSGDPYGHLIGPSKAHAIVLRGDAIGVGQIGYGIERGGYTTFVEWGGVWRFRQIRDTFNNILFEINPLFVNVPTALRVNNVDVNDIYQTRPWISIRVDYSSFTQRIITITQRGRKTASVEIVTNGFSVGFESHPHGDTYVVSATLIGSNGLFSKVRLHPRRAI